MSVLRHVEESLIHAGEMAKSLSRLTDVTRYFSSIAWLSV